MSAAASSGSAVLCRRCGGELTCVEVVDHSHSGPRIEVYRCGEDDALGCRIKAVLMYESASGVVTDEERSWVEREVERRGSFFPQDYGGGVRRR